MKTGKGRFYSFAQRPLDDDRGPAGKRLSIKKQRRESRENLFPQQRTSSNSRRVGKKNWRFQKKGQKGEKGSDFFFGVDSCGTMDGAHCK